MKSGTERFLAVYSAVLTIVFAATVASGFAQTASRKQVFDEIDVKRINLVEPDGRLRMVIADKADFPGIIIKGQEHPHPNRTTAGILFFNDEGTENGGLTFGGAKDSNGHATSYGHLSFDEYEQDQVLTLDASQQGEQRGQSLKLVDNPDWDIEQLIALTDQIRSLPKDQQQAAMAKFYQTHTLPRLRLYLGRSDDKSVSLKLKDADAKDRLILRVAADGTPTISFLDATGKVVRSLP